MISSLLSLALAASPGLGADATVERSRGLPASAVTVSYEAEVVAWQGSLPEVWEVGQRINVSYTLNPDGPFEQLGSDWGRHTEGVVSIRIEVPHLALLVEGGNGYVNVVDDRPFGDFFSDGLSILSHGVGGAPVIGGEVVVATGVEAFDWGPAPGVPSSMVQDFALPLHPLRDVTSLQAYLRTSAGNSGFIEFRSVGEPELVTVDYASTVTRATGVHASEFVVGEPVVISYTLDPSVPDSSTNPETGIYSTGLRSLTVVMERLNSMWNGGSGDVYVFNDAGSPPSDQVFFISNSSTGTVAGLPVTTLEVDFVETPEEGLPGMLDSKAMPLEQLEAGDAFILFYTSAGLTFVGFDAAPDVPADRMPELIAEARDAIAWLIASPSTARSVVRTLGRLVDPIESAHAAEDRAQACFEVGRARTQLDLLVRMRRVAGAETADLRGILAEMELELGCHGG